MNAKWFNGYPKEERDLSLERSNQEILSDNGVYISFLGIGCTMSFLATNKSLPFESVEEGMAAFNAYVQNPREEIKKWNEIFENQK